MNIMNSKIERIFPKIIKLILAASLVVPILYAKNLLFLFITTKVFTFYFLIELSLILFAVLIYFNNKYFSVNKKNKILAIFTLYFGVKVVSDLLGFSFFKSFWGGYERMMGLFTWIHLFIFLILLISFFKKKKDYFALFDVSIATSLFVAFYGLMQKMNIGGDFVIHRGIDRIDSTIGNAAFLASYLIFNIFFAVYLFLQKNDVTWKLYYVFVVLFESAILFFTATRGGILGLTVGLGLLLLLNLFLTTNKRVKKYSVAVILLFLVISTGIYLNRDSDFVQNSKPLKRITGMSFSDATVNSRLTLWKKSFQICLERPVFGWGENNINIAIDKYYTEDINEDWFDSTHSVVFDNLISHGFVGLFVYAYLLLYLLIYLFKHRKENTVEFLVFSSLLVAYFVQNLFLFDTIVTMTMFLLVVAFIVSINDFDKKISGEKRGYSVFIVIFLIVSSVVFMFLNTKALRSAHYIAESKRYSAVNPIKSIELYDMALKNSFYGFEDIGNVGGDWIREIFNKKTKFNGNINDLIMLTERSLVKSIERDPLYSKNYLVLSKVFQNGREYDDKYIDKSIELLEKAVECSPKRLSIYKGLAQAYYLKGDYGKSIEYLEMASGVSLDPGRIYFEVALVTLVYGDIDGFNERIKKAGNLGYEVQLNDYLKLANIAIDNNHLQTAIWSYEKAIEIDSSRVDFYAGIATIYKELGNIDKAKEFAYMILEIDQSAKNIVEEFIAGL